MSPLRLLPSVVAYLAFGCGGVAVDQMHDDSKGSGVGATEAQDASSTTGGAAGSGRDASSPPHGEDATGTGGASGDPLDANPSPEAGGTCSMPVGTLEPGCPIVLAPACPLANWWQGLGFDACDYALDPSMTTDDPDALPYWDVALGMPDGTEPGRLLRVADEAGCATTGNGWYFDEPEHPKFIHICPNACECAKATGKPFSLAWGCWGNAAPGVLESEIACPRCGTSRQKSCAAAAGGWGYGIPKCEFSVESPYMPYQGDPMQVNLKYEQHGATAGKEEPWDGYLPHIPSLAHCDQVEEGWTLDLSTSPPTVRICPSTCSCATVSGAVFMVEYGCPRYEAAGL